MGVYIKRLKLPSAERQGELLILTDDGRCVDMFNREYEAVELQPHCRLIEEPKQLSYDGLVYISPYDAIGTAKYFLDQIRAMPTIIEGDGT